MKTTLILTFLMITLASGAVSAADNKLLVAGDSWASFLCVQNSFTRVFENYQDPKAFNHAGCYLTTQIGMRANEWLPSKQHRRTLKLLEKDRLIKVLFLSLGGNDLLNDVNKNMPVSEQDRIFESIYQKTAEIVRIYQAVRPDLKIIVSGYDFPRFTPNHPISAYRNVYNDLGQPTPAELNQVLIRFSLHMTQLNRLANVAYIHHLGVMHYFDGNSDEGFSPMQTLHPDLISHPQNPKSYGGILQAMAARKSMLRVSNKFVDAFHLSVHGYYRLAEHTYRLYLQSWLGE